MDVLSNFGAVVVETVTDPTEAVEDTPVTDPISVNITDTLPTNAVMNTASLPTGSNPKRDLLSIRDLSGLGFLRD